MCVREWMCQSQHRMNDPRPPLSMSAVSFLSLLVPYSALLIPFSVFTTLAFPHCTLRRAHRSTFMIPREAVIFYLLASFWLHFVTGFTWTSQSFASTSMIPRIGLVVFLLLCLLYCSWYLFAIRCPLWDLCIFFEMLIVMQYRWLLCIISIIISILFISFGFGLLYLYLY